MEYITCMHILIATMHMHHALLQVSSEYPHYPGRHQGTTVATETIQLAFLNQQEMRLQSVISDGTIITVARMVPSLIPMRAHYSRRSHSRGVTVQPPLFVAALPLHAIY